MGLLTDWVPDDPSSQQGLMALAAGMMAGRPSQGLLGFAQATSPESRAKLNLTNAQIDDMKQQIGLRNLQLQQQQAQWEMLAPIMRQYAGGGAGGAMPPSAPSQSAIAPSAGGPMGSGTFGIPTGGQDASTPPTAPAGAGGGSMFGVPRDVGIPTLLFGGPQEFAKTIASYNTPTDFQKLLTSQGIDPRSAQGQALMAQQIKKQNNIPLQAGRSGAPMYDSDGNVVAMAPKIPDNAIPQIVGGRVTGVSPLPGGQQVSQMNAYAEAAGKAQTKPITGYRGTQPVFTNELAAAQSGDVQPQAGVSGSFDTSKDSLESIAAAIAGIRDPQERANAQAAFESQVRKQGTQLTPGLSPGIASSQEALATQNAKRYGSVIDMASDSPTRVNVYDNILNLSKQGVATGPGQAWMNSVKGYAANTPLLGSVLSNWKDDVSGFQELNKFMYQNAQRNWQAAGGTGTDAQLEAFTHANPNDKMFPQALQAMAQWGKGGELALQGKANAMQAWKDQQGGNVAGMDKFEGAWRNSFDPTLFQLKAMPPAQQQQYVNNLKFSNPQAYQALMAKAQVLKQMGGL